MTWNQLAWKKKPSVEERQVETIEWLDGVLEIPRHGFFNATELQYLREADPANAEIRNLYHFAVQLANAIGDDSNWNSVKCYGLLSLLWAKANGGRFEPTSEQAQVLVEHNVIVSDYIKKMAEARSIVKVRTVTIVLQRNTPSWTDEMTKELPGHLQDKIYHFANQELSAGMGQVDIEEAQRQMEEDLGKLEEASQSILSDQTSTPSSGNAADSGPAPPNSPVKTTARSRDGSSSTRSRKATKPTKSGFTKTS